MQKLVIELDRGQGWQDSEFHVEQEVVVLSGC